MLTLDQRNQRVVVIASVVSLLLFSYGTRGSGSELAESAPNASSCLDCHSRLDGVERAVVELHVKSSHQRIGCEHCHNGQPEATEKLRAHSGDFAGKPDRAGTLKMCAHCHEAPLEQLKVGRHFRKDLGTARIDCVTCHGAHSIGSPPETFSFVQFCSGCHGLEYLPRLPATVQQLLEATDVLRAAFRTAQSRGTALPAELIENRQTIRRRVSEIVHPTDVTGGTVQIPGIIEDSRLLAERVSRLSSKGER